MEKREVEKIKVIAYDENWELIEDRPDDYFCRFHRDQWTLDVYYGKKGTVRLKKIKGENCYLYFQNPKKVEQIFQNPMEFYKGVSFTHT